MKFLSFLFGGSDSPSQKSDGANLTGFVDYVVKALVDSPKDVRIEEEFGEEELKIIINCRKEDIGRVIGRRGKTIDAIRSLVRGAATRQNRRVMVEIAEE